MSLVRNILPVLLNDFQTRNSPIHDPLNNTNETESLGCSCLHSSLEDTPGLHGTLIFGSIITILVIIIGGFSNFLTLCSLSFQFTLPRIYRHVLTSSSTVLIINLALADLIYSIICLPPVLYIYVRVLQADVSIDKVYQEDFD